MLTGSLNRRGAALFMAMLIAIAVAGIALGGVLLSSGADLSTRYNAKEALLQSSADGGLEIIRDSLNRGVFDSLLPATGFTTLASQVPVLDALGNAEPRINLSLYVGRTGGRTGGAATAGQYGSNFASALSIISDTRGAVAARRLLLTQESWAKFAVAINNWSGSAEYGCGESVNGPFFSNSGLIIQTGCGAGSGTLFTNSVNVVGSITGSGSGRFDLGFKTGVAPIPWPTPARIALMQQYAQDGDAAGGDYDLTSLTTGSTKPGLRIEFVTIDVNGNGLIDWDEGFMRVWIPANTGDSVLAYATGRRWPSVPGGTTQSDDPNMISRNCGGVTQINGTGPTQFFTADSVYDGTGGGSGGRTAVRALLSSTTDQRRCYLGGDPHLFTGVTHDTLTPDSTITNLPLASNNFGWWRKRRSGAFASLTGVRAGDASYLIPLGANPNFKGVIYVNGDVALSGKLRGRVSVFATGNIVMADDLLYQNPPGTNCSATGDIFGAIATKDVVIEDNNLQTPFGVNGKVYGGFDDTNDANYNMFLLAAGDGSGTNGNWYGEGVTSPWNYYTSVFPTSGAEPGSANSNWDISAINQSCGTAVNGCVRVTGGLAEGRVDDATYYGSGYYGWAEAHTYDACGSVNPPPYFPTTGRFIPSRYYEIDPVWLNSIGIAAYFTRLQSQ
ncbi:MAG TPA: hypothetical protein VGL65_02830 [Gemmatimonadales bacterium]|jgi:hypothetical protein